MVSRLTCTGTLYFRATGTTGDNYTVVPSERRLRHLRCCLAPSAQQAASSASVELGADEEAVYSLAQVSEHADRRSAWVALNGGVYDFTSFLGAHPGGARSVLRHAGTDATAIFGELHSDSIFATFAPAYRIGTLLEDGTAAPTSLPGPIGIFSFSPSAPDAGAAATRAPRHDTAVAEVAVLASADALHCQRMARRQGGPVALTPPHPTESTRNLPPSRHVASQLELGRGAAHRHGSHRRHNGTIWRL